MSCSVSAKAACFGPDVYKRQSKGLTFRVFLRVFPGWEYLITFLPGLPSYFVTSSTCLLYTSVRGRLWTPLAVYTQQTKYIGWPYVWGGSSPSTSFDCSGFVHQWVLAVVVGKGVVLSLIHIFFGQRLCVGQFAPCHQPAVCHRTDVYKRQNASQAIIFVICRSSIPTARIAPDRKSVV